MSKKKRKKPRRKGKVISSTTLFAKGRKVSKTSINIAIMMFFVTLCMIAVVYALPTIVIPTWAVAAPLIFGFLCLGYDSLSG